MAKAVLITGPAGSGKTNHCLQICREALGKYAPGRVIYLVPSAEAVRDTERELLSRGDSRGILGSVVMDFVSLAARILRDAGCSPVRRVGSLERRYLILQIIRETRLSFFGSVKEYEGFAEVVSEFIAELKRGMISPEDFLEGCLAAAGRGGMARDKVLELHAIYSKYQDALKKRSAYDGDGLQWMAAEVLAATPSLLSSVEVLLVDGFATYTPVELEILGLLVGRVGESHITLCYERGRAEVFDFVEPSCSRLRKLCAAGEVVSTGERRCPRELVDLERTLFGEEESSIPAGGTVSVIPCSDALREAATVAREIEKMRAEEGLEYRDFMVILRDVSEYLPAISEAFGERGIPVSIAGAAQLADEPFISTVVSALQLAKGEFRHEQVLAVLKNSYVKADKDAVAEIENYVEEFGFWDEEGFRTTWKETGETTRDVNRLNAEKTRFLEMLDKLRSEARKILSAEGFRDFVFRVISEMGFLHGSEDAAGTDGRVPRIPGGPAPAFSSEYRCLSSLAHLLDAICEYLRLMALPSADYGTFLDMLEQGLSLSPVHAPPRNQNSVRVSSIVGGAPPASPVVFVCGLCERSFPREIVNEPFFKDRERRLINRRGKIILDERLPLSSGERFFFYMAVSRATRRLILTYPVLDTAGKELVPSHYVEEVTRLFSDLRDPVGKEPPGVKVVPDFGEVADAEELRRFIAHHLSRKTEVAGDEDQHELQNIALLAYNELSAVGALSPDHLIYRPPDEERSLSEPVFHAFKESDVYLTSVSELETFARCPFRHFCQYRLRLKELPRYEFSHVQEGILYHDVLARLYREIYLPESAENAPGEATGRNQPTGIENIALDKLSDRVAGLVEEFINSGYSRLFRTPRMQVRRRAMETRIRDFVLKEVENQGVNETRPTYFELSFGEGRSRLNADSRSTTKCLSFSSRDPADEEGSVSGAQTVQPDRARRGTGVEDKPLIRLSGRIDRVDVFEEGADKFGIVLDYKRSEERSKAQLSRGTVLQPGLYMLALKDIFGLKPAGAFYFSISTGRKRGIFAVEEQDRISGQGDVSRSDRASYQEIADLIEMNAREAAEYAERILHGDISVKPADQDECKHCPFSSICRIEDR